MKSWMLAGTAIVVLLAGCLETAGTDGVRSASVEADAVSTNADVLEVALSANQSFGTAPLEITVSFDVASQAADVEWDLFMTWDKDNTEFKMGSGGVDALPGERNVTLAAGTYVITMVADADNETSQATLTIDVAPGESDDVEVEDPCESAGVFFTFTNPAGTQYVDFEHGAWLESNDRDGLQTETSCPEGPHDTKVA